MSPVQDAAVQRRRLRGELRRAREAAGHTQRDVALAMDWSLSKLTRIESGKVGISTNDLRALLNHYGVNDAAEVDRFIKMARTSKTERAWWTGYREAISPQFLSFLSYENSASAIYHFEPMVVPGLLQEEEYARAVLQALSGSATSRRVEELVELRMKRQEELLYRQDPPEMLFIMDEAALHRWIGGHDVMRHQLLHLRQIAAEQSKVTIEVIPFTAGAHPGMKGPFVILEFADDVDEDVLFLEDFRGDVISRDEREEIDPAREALGTLRDLARKESIESAIDRTLKEMS